MGLSDFYIKHKKYSSITSARFWLFWANAPTYVSINDTVNQQKLTDKKIFVFARDRTGDLLCVRQM